MPVSLARRVGVFEPLLAHGSGIDDIGLVALGLLLVAGFLVSIRRMREMEAREASRRAERDRGHTSPPEHRR